MAPDSLKFLQLSYTTRLFPIFPLRFNQTNLLTLRCKTSMSMTTCRRFYSPFHPFNTLIHLPISYITCVIGKNTLRVIMSVSKISTSATVTANHISRSLQTETTRAQPHPLRPHARSEVWLLLKHQ